MHSFNENIAAQYGIAEAVLIDHFQYWIKLNKRNERHEHDGRTWTYATAKSLSEWFPYLSEKQIWLAINKLVDAGVLIKGNFNRTKYDRTTWYAFTLESFWIKPEGEFHFPKQENHNPKSAGPIPASEKDTLKTKETIPAADAPAGEKKPAKDPPKEKKGGPDHEWQRWVDRWFDHFKARHDGIDPMFNAAQASALKKLRAYLCKVALPVPGKTIDDGGYLAWCYILDNWDRLREWLQGQFDLTVIHKKINDILNSLRNGTQTNRGLNSNGARSGTSEQRVDAVRNY